MKQVSFTVWEGARRVLVLVACVVLFILACLVMGAIAGRYEYHASQPMGFGYPPPMPNRLIGSH